MSVHQRGPGQWQVRWRVDGKQRALVFATKAEATKFDAEVKQLRAAARAAAHKRAADEALRRLRP